MTENDRTFFESFGSGFSSSCINELSCSTVICWNWRRILVRAVAKPTRDCCLLDDNPWTKRVKLYLRLLFSCKQYDNYISYNSTNMYLIDTYKECLLWKFHNVITIFLRKLIRVYSKFLWWVLYMSVITIRTSNVQCQWHTACVKDHLCLQTTCIGGKGSWKCISQNDAPVLREHLS